MNVLVTGADGFVGSYLVPRLLETGHRVLAGVHPAPPDDLRAKRRRYLEGAEIVALDLADDDGYS